MLGHAGVEGNEMADMAAKVCNQSAADRQENSPCKNGAQNLRRWGQGKPDSSADITLEMLL